MPKRNHSRQANRRRQRVSRRQTLNSLYRRPLRYEPLEDRRLLAVVTVNTVDDTVNFNDGLTSLREAIFATNLVGGADTIDFAPALTANGPATILLTQGELKITDSLTINGPGANLLTIDATPNDPTPNLNNGDGSRVFNLDDGNLNNLIQVSLRGLTLTGGDTNSGGGAILSREQLSIEQSVIRDNATIGLGGGILARFGSVSLIDSTLSGNVATSHGGGIYHRGDFQNQFATLTITDSTISGNTAGGNGGGVFAFNSDSHVTASTISGNTAVEGGGVFANGRSLIVDGTTVSGNRSSGAGGGIRKTGSGWLEIGQSSTISRNTAGGNGGGLSLGNGSEGTISNSTISDNTANGRGGGIASEGELSLVVSTVHHNSATNSGGGVAVLAGTAKIDRSTLQHNTAREGGGLDVRGVGTSVTVQASTIEGNKAGSSGGGIHNRATVSITNSTVRSNAASVAGGGLAGLAANTTIFASTINDNTAPLGAGIAGVAAANVLTITNSTVSSNLATDHAAGIFSAGRLTLKHSTVTGNRAARVVGGVGVYGPTEFSHTIVAGNTVGGTPNDLRGNATVAFSLLGVDTGATITDNGGNLLGTAATPIDPKLGPLADNGGVTLPDGSHILTHALLPGSPAINAGDLNLKAGVDGVPQFDERGTPFSRVVNGRIDIGAFEYQAASDLNLLVDTLVDESDGNYTRGDLSLREAIELANLWPSVDTIHFAPALTASGPATILLSRGSLLVVGNMTIVGPGMNLLTIEGTGNDPTPDVDDGKGQSVFAIWGGALNFNVAMSGLTVTGGDASSAGGGIFGRVGSLTLNQMKITGNAARTGGGGVAMSQGTLVLNDSTVTNNSSGGSRGAGGGINVFGGQLTVARSTISGNIATNFGGGIYFSDSVSTTANQLVIDHSTISNNSATQGGGGIWASVDVGTIALEDNTIAGNRVTGGRGGGLYISARNATPTTITRNTIEKNSAGFGGGALLNINTGELLMDECTISENSATSGKGSGGGISLAGQSARATIRSSTISANTATAIAGNGGGVAASGITLKVESSTITGNAAYGEGGGISSYSSLEVVNSQISSNRVDARNGGGGGIAQRGGSLSISDSTIATNSSAGYGGGLMASGQTQQVTIMRSQIANNSAAIDGGGIQRKFGTNVTLYIFDSTLSGNTAGRDGGAINVDLPGSSAAKVSSTAITGNVAGRSGGGIAQHGTGGLNLGNSTISNNTAVANGGGILADDGAPWLNSSTISGNSAGAQGGGLWTAKAADVRYSTIAQNRAVGAAGGIFASSGPLTLDHTIVASNTAPAGPDVTGLLGTTISPRYSLIGSSANSGLSPAPIGSPVANGNLIGGTTAATTIDPKLGTLANNGGFTLPDGSHILTHALLAGSPAINAGDPLVIGGALEFDQRGTPFTRVYGGRIDIGAIESQPTLLVGDYHADGVADAADYVLWRKSMESQSTLLVTAPAFVAPPARTSPGHRAVFAATRPNDFRPSMADHLLAAVAASPAAPAQRAAFAESATTIATRDDFAPARRKLLNAVDEAFAAFAPSAD